MTLPGIDFPGLGVGLAILRDGKLLLCRRMKAPESGHWNIVGGKVDQMEPAADAAKREAEEETGLTIGPITYLGVTEQIIEADGQTFAPGIIGVMGDFRPADRAGVVVENAGVWLGHAWQVAGRGCGTSPVPSWDKNRDE